MYNYPNYQNTVYGQNTAYQNVLPPQQVITVNGKASVDSIRMSPNSSVIVVDSTAPMVWMCVSDGIGKVTATGYDITPHIDAPPVDVNSLESRIANLEQVIKNMEGKHEQSNVTESKRIPD